MLGPFATASRLTPIHQMSLAVLSRTACALMSTTTTTTTTRDRVDRYGPMEWAQIIFAHRHTCRHRYSKTEVPCINRLLRNGARPLFLAKILFVM